MIFPHLKLAHHYWEQFLKPNDFVIDATCGNGHDALALANLILTESSGHLLCIDLQEVAIESTRSHLKNHLPPTIFKNISFHQGNHVQFPPLLAAPRLIVYNLGFLPGGNKDLTTETKTTLDSLKTALELLQCGGALSIMCYSGHPEGEKEEKALLSFASSLDSNQFLVCHHSWLNRFKSPSLLLITKK